MKLNELSSNKVNRKRIGRGPGSGTGKTSGKGHKGQNAQMNIDVIPTGALSLDIALGIGGVPRGRIVEVFGPESSGKTTVALHMIAEAKREQEALSLKRSGDFFRKVIVTGGQAQPLADDDGIVHVGVIPFLLDRGILAERFTVESCGFGFAVFFFDRDGEFVGVFSFHQDVGFALSCIIAIYRNCGGRVVWNLNFSIVLCTADNCGAAREHKYKCYRRDY